jgi:hypothetical protein
VSKNGEHDCEPEQIRGHPSAEKALLALIH